MVVKIYTSAQCGWCTKTKSYLINKGVEYEECRVDLNDDYKKEVYTKSKQISLPVLDIDGTIVIGFDKKQIDSLI